MKINEVEAELATLREDNTKLGMALVQQVQKTKQQANDISVLTEQANSKIVTPPVASWRSAITSFLELVVQGKWPLQRVLVVQQGVLQLQSFLVLLTQRYHRLVVLFSVIVVPTQY